MKKILLTSTGFDNINIKNKFIELLEKEPKQAKILFVTTAANNPEAIRILPFCLDDLTNCGIKEKNITVYDMHKLIPEQEIKKYDAIYVCGGSTEYLEERIEEIKIQPIIKEYIENGGIYIGVSAGSIVASGNFKNGLNLIENKLDVHCNEGTPNGKITTKEQINLTDNQALYISDKENIIFE